MFFAVTVIMNLIFNSTKNIRTTCMRAGACLSEHSCPHPSVCLRFSTCVCVSLSSDSSSSGNPSRLPGQPAPTSWCMRSRWSGVAATTAQPYLITNKRVVPSVRYQAFSAKQTVIPASQTLALLSLPTTWWELHWDRRSNYTPYLILISTLIHLPKLIQTGHDLQLHTGNKISVPDRRPFILPPYQVMKVIQIHVADASCLKGQNKTADIKCLSLLKQNFNSI